MVPFFGPPCRLIDRSTVRENSNRQLHANSNFRQRRLWVLKIAILPLNFFYKIGEVLASASNYALLGENVSTKRYSDNFFMAENL